MYVEKGEFELAKQYCKDNPAHVDQVLIKQAEMYFNNKQYVTWHVLQDAFVSAELCYVSDFMSLHLFF